jgi:Cys-tRNA(Pro) deacylase
MGDIVTQVETMVTKYLDEKRISYTIRLHAKPAFTSEDAARERGVRLSQIVKCMIGVGGTGTMYAMLLPGDRTLKLRKVARLAGDETIRLMPVGEIEKQLGVTVGAISPVQLIGRALIYMDDTVFEEVDVDISSGDPDAGIELKAEDLCRILDAKRCDIISTRRVTGA